MSLCYCICCLQNKPIYPNVVCQLVSQFKKVSIKAKGLKLKPSAVKAISHKTKFKFHTFGLRSRTIYPNVVHALVYLVQKSVITLTN